MIAERADRPGRESFFGRRRGKQIRPGQAEAHAALLPRYRLDVSRPAPQRLAELFAREVADVRMEIGFGAGEHLLHQARSAPETGFIGIEPFINGMARLMKVLEAEPLDNLRVFDDDATIVLDWLPEASLAGVDLLYPDPWPKRRHWKRRFVRLDNLDRLARVLRKGGLFRFASDIDGYVNWTLIHCRQHGAFEWLADSADDWRRPWPGWPGTRYEAKALAAGRRPAYLSFCRV